MNWPIKCLSSGRPLQSHRSRSICNTRSCCSTLCWCDLSKTSGLPTPSDATRSSSIPLPPRTNTRINVFPSMPGHVAGDALARVCRHASWLHMVGFAGLKLCGCVSVHCVRLQPVDGWSRLENARAYVCVWSSAGRRATRWPATNTVSWTQRSCWGECMNQAHPHAYMHTPTHTVMRYSNGYFKSPPRCPYWAVAPCC